MPDEASKNKRLLVIDDDLTAGPLIQAALRNLFSVSFERSGAAALPGAIALEPDAILLDLHMPNVDGFEVLRQMKRHPIIASIPIICMSGATDQESRSRAVSLGASGYLQKPLNLKELGADLGALLKSLNVAFESPSKKRRFVIAFNGLEKDLQIRSELSSTLDAGGKALILSLRTGADFSNSELDREIESGRVCYLQISPGLISKFPFLQDLTPVIDDIKGFVGGATHDYRLFFDDPHLVIHAQDPAGALARLHTLKKALSTAFDSVSFFCSRDHTSVSVEVLNEMAAVFCQ